jgi:hypothetical protein
MEAVSPCDAQLDATNTDQPPSDLEEALPPAHASSDVKNTMASDLRGVKGSTDVSGSSTNLKGTVSSANDVCDDSVATIPRIVKGVQGT